MLDLSTRECNTLRMQSTFHALFSVLSASISAGLNLDVRDLNKKKKNINSYYTLQIETMHYNV